jgi:hypothetical protein
VGTLTLINADRALNPYEGYAWGEIGVWLWTEGTPSGSATPVITGLCSQPVYSKQEDAVQDVKVTLYDYSIEASKALQTHVYAGTNGDPGVLYESTADGAKGALKPLAFGNLVDAQIPPPLVNAGEQAYQLHDGAIEGHEALFDRGDDFGLVDSGDLAGAAFDAAAPAAAHYVTDLGRGLVKFNSTPVGQFTVGFKGDASDGYVETPGPVLARLMTRAGIPAGRIGGTLAVLASAAVVGFYAAEQTTLAAAIGLVAPAASAAVLPDRYGVWQAIAFGPPAATPDVAIGETQVLNCTADDAAPAPVGEVKIGWGRIWKTFGATELAPALLGTDAQTRLAAEYRYATVASDTVKARFPRTWSTVTVDTALRNEADAIALASSLSSLLALKDDGKPRRFWRVTVEIDTALAQQLGQTVQFTYPRQGLSGNFLLVGEEPLRPRRSQAIWTLWG